MRFEFRISALSTLFVLKTDFTAQFCRSDNDGPHEFKASLEDRASHANRCCLLMNSLRFLARILYEDKVYTCSRHCFIPLLLPWGNLLSLAYANDVRTRTLSFSLLSSRSLSYATCSKRGSTVLSIRRWKS